MMGKTALIAVWLVALALFSIYGTATSIDLINISDTISADRSLSETVSMTISANNQANFTLVLPAAAHGIMLGNESINSTTVVIPTDCTRCSFTISYLLSDVAKEDTNKSLAFSRTLNYGLKPATFRYAVTLPKGYGVDQSADLAEPSIVPAESSIITDGSQFTVVWNSTSQAFPIRYYIRYAPIVEPPASRSAIPLLGGLCVVFLSSSLFFGLKYRRAAKKHHPAQHSLESAPPTEAETPASAAVVVPGSLLTVDEKAVLNLIRQNNNLLHQKEVVKLLNWSKSKVSAIVSNLEYKKILRREKLGRSYRIELVRDFVEGI
jgi:uncharacterized membrane protein